MQKIDFVVTWVNGEDPSWLESKAKYAEKSDITLNTVARYRDWDIFSYWFRAIEQYAPWVNKIFLITEGHLPKWINLSHPKLVHIRHSDYIDGKYLPTFNSNVIELNIPNIKELSDKFVLFNDDMFINAPVSPEDFFDINGLPKDIGIFSPIIPLFGGISSITLNNLEIINKYFNSKDVLKKSFRKFYNFKYGKHLLKNICVSPWKSIIGFYDQHITVSYDKNYFIKLYNQEKDSFIRTNKTRFRTPENINHWLIRYYQLCDGYFSSRKVSFGKYYNISTDILDIKKDISDSIHKVICLNDGDGINDFDKLKSELLLEFSKKYSRKSNFEL